MTPSSTGSIRRPTEGEQANDRNQRRALQDHLQARHRRDGGGVRGRRYDSRPSRGPQVPSSRARPGRVVAPTLPARSEGRLGTEPPEHLHHPWDRATRIRALHRDGAARRGDSERADPAGSVGREYGSDGGDSDRGRPRIGALQRDRPSRPQAGEHLHDFPRTGENPRLRPGQDRPWPPRRSFAHDDGCAWAKN
jgi:hypothetical protein